MEQDTRLEVREVKETKKKSLNIHHYIQALTKTIHLKITTFYRKSTELQTDTRI